MTLSHMKETQGLMLYVFCVIVTTVLITFKPLWGLLTLIWGFIGFYRYLYLNSSRHLKIPKILTLPSRILFDLTQEQKNNIDSAIERFLQKDILLFFAFALLYIFWGIYCSFNPLNLELFQSFWQTQENIVQQSQQENPFTTTHINAYVVIEKISLYLIYVLILFIGLSYQSNESFDKNIVNRVSVMLLIIASLFISFIFKTLPLSDTLMDLRFSHLKGIGWGQVENFFSLSRHDQLPDTGFFRRYIEMGLVGAIGLYIVFLPLVLTFIKNYTSWRCLSCLVALLILAAIDAFIAVHPLMLSAQIAILGYLTLTLKAYSPLNQKP